MSKQEPSGEVPGVSVSDSQGVQVGSGNTMYNLAPKPPLDPVALSGRNPHAAVTLLRQVSHDDLVDFFIRAQPGDVAEILEVFTEVDLLKVVATLGDLSRRKATELIAAVSEGDKDPLNRLPQAAEAIARKAAGLRWADAEPLEYLNGGFVRKYKGGHVHWSPESGLRMTIGPINA